jgi:hypothetical protein
LTCSAGALPLAKRAQLLGLFVAKVGLRHCAARLRFVDARCFAVPSCATARSDGSVNRSPAQ